MKSSNSIHSGSVSPLYASRIGIVILSVLLMVLVIQNVHAGAAVMVRATDAQAREPYDYVDSNGQTVRNINNGEFEIGTDGFVGDVYFTLSGTATVNEGVIGNCVPIDYHVEFPDGGGTISGNIGKVTLNSSGTDRKRVRIVPVEDFLCEPTETVICTITPEPYYTVFYGPATVYIRNGPLSYKVDATQSSAIEGQSVLTFRIKNECSAAGDNQPPDPNDGPGTNPTTVGYDLSGTALPGVDYPETAHGFAYFNGTQEAYVSIHPTLDCLTEGPETVILSLGQCAVPDHTATGTINDGYTVPTVSITSPVDGSILSWPFVSYPIIQADASDMCGISRVDFYEDSTLLGTATTPPYQCIWKYPHVGNHTVRAVARNVAGLASESSVSVTVLTSVRPVPFEPQITDSRFSFSITAVDGTYAIETSDDNVNWNSAGTVTISENRGSFTDTTIAGISHRFYKVSNGDCCSQAIGFARVDVGGGDAYHWSPIANQFDVSVGGGNMLSDVFANSSLPDQTRIEKWNQSRAGYDVYEYSAGSSSWTPVYNSPVEHETLSPGEFAYIQNTTGGVLHLVFVGLVREGVQTIPIVVQSNWNYVSSPIPQAGGVASTFGLAPKDFDMVFTWNGSGWNTAAYLTSQWIQDNAPEYYLQPPYYDANGNYLGPWFDDTMEYPIAEPTVPVGQAFVIVPGTENYDWTRNYSSCD